MARAKAKPAARTQTSVLPAEPAGRLVVELLELLRQNATRPIVHICADSRRADLLLAIAQAFAPELRVALLPAWDCLPYDSASPSCAAMGHRSGVLRWLTDKGALPDILFATPAALIQRVPPRDIWGGAHVEFALAIRSMRKLSHRLCNASAILSMNLPMHQVSSQFADA
jgi:transcription-repair coupling factor (superfamily II helicase)